MEKSFNMQVAESKNTIIKTISETNLPLTVLSMMLHEITNSIDVQANSELNKEYEELNKPQKK